MQALFHHCWYCSNIIHSDSSKLGYKICAGFRTHRISQQPSPTKWTSNIIYSYTDLNSAFLPICDFVKNKEKCSVNIRLHMWVIHGHLQVATHTGMCFGALSDFSFFGKSIPEVPQASWTCNAIKLATLHYIPLTVSLLSQVKKKLHSSVVTIPMKPCDAQFSEE